MPNLTLSAEIQCYPVWVEKEGLNENVDPAALPISSELIAALDDWRARWDATYDLDDPLLSPGFASAEEERQFATDGERLAGWIRAELDADWTVTLHVPT